MRLLLSVIVLNFLTAIFSLPTGSPAGTGSPEGSNSNASRGPSSIPDTELGHIFFDPATMLGPGKRHPIVVIGYSEIEKKMVFAKLHAAKEVGIIETKAIHKDLPAELEKLGMHGYPYMSLKLYGASLAADVTRKNLLAKERHAEMKYGVIRKFLSEAMLKAILIRVNTLTDPNKKKFAVYATMYPRFDWNVNNQYWYLISISNGPPASEEVQLGTIFHHTFQGSGSLPGKRLLLMVVGFKGLDTIIYAVFQKSRPAIHKQRIERYVPGMIAELKNLGIDEEEYGGISSTLRVAPIQDFKASLDSREETQVLKEDLFTSFMGYLNTDMLEDGHSGIEASDKVRIADSVGRDIRQMTKDYRGYLGKRMGEAPSDPPPRAGPSRTGPSRADSVGRPSVTAFYGSSNNHQIYSMGSETPPPPPLYPGGAASGASPPPPLYPGSAASGASPPPPLYPGSAASGASLPPPPYPGGAASGASPPPPLYPGSAASGASPPPPPYPIIPLTGAPLPPPPYSPRRSTQYTPYDASNRLHRPPPQSPPPDRSS